MARVELIAPQDAPLTARRLLGDTPGPLPATWAHVPELLAVTLPFVGKVFGASAIDARTKEIVILRASAEMACRYCVQTHTVVALDSGLSAAEVRALRGESDLAEAFEDPCELALVAWTDAVAAGPRPISEVEAEAIRAHFDDAAVVELTLLVGATVMLNRYATALALPASPATLTRLAQEGLA